MKTASGIILMLFWAATAASAAVVCTPSDETRKGSRGVSLHLFHQIAVVSNDTKDFVLRCTETNADDRRSVCEMDENEEFKGFLLIKEIADNVILFESYDTTRVAAGGAGRIKFESMEFKCASTGGNSEIDNNEPQDRLPSAKLD